MPFFPVNHEICPIRTVLVLNFNLVIEKISVKRGIALKTLPVNPKTSVHAYLSMGIPVSANPGVSTTQILRRNLSADPYLQILVTDLAEICELKVLEPNRVLPVSLFPAPVFPIKTMRFSVSCFASSNCSIFYCIFSSNSIELYALCRI